MSKHFYISEESIHGRRAVLSPVEAHHLKSVMRKKKGDSVQLLTGRGKLYEGKILSLEPKLEIEIFSSKIQEEACSPLLILCPALLKSGKMDWLVEKATELGAHVILPFEAAHGVAKLKDEAQKIARLERIAQSALKQSGRGLLPQVGPCLGFEELLEYAGGQNALKLLFSLEDVRSTPLSGLASLIQKKGECAAWIFLIGPEGGFSPAEEKRAIEAGFHLCSLGPQTLRAETAGIAALSILKYLREAQQ